MISLKWNRSPGLVANFKCFKCFVKKVPPVAAHRVCDQKSKDRAPPSFLLLLLIINRTNHSQHYGGIQRTTTRSCLSSTTVLLPTIHSGEPKFTREGAHESRRSSHRQKSVPDLCTRPTTTCQEGRLLALWASMACKCTSLFRSMSYRVGIQSRNALLTVTMASSGPR